MKAIPTLYKGIWFRSRLEAKWAAFFDALEWQWEYEPVDFNRWIPDFVLYGKWPVYVEVKPAIAFPSDIANEIDRSGCEDEVLIVGQRPLLPEMECSLGLGWLREGSEPLTEAIKEPIPYPVGFFEATGIPIETVDLWEDVTLWEEGGWWWDEAEFGVWCDNNVGFCHSSGTWVDRISGTFFGSYPSPEEERIKRLWAKAKNKVQWKGSHH